MPHSRRPQTAPSTRSRPRRSRGRRPAPIRARHPACRRQRCAGAASRPAIPTNGRRLERGRRPLHGQGQSGERSERGRCELSARLAALLFRAVAGADFAPASRPPTSARSTPICCTPNISIRRSKSCAFRLKVRKSSAICGCRANAARPVPLVLAISGLDSRKETVAETYAAALPRRHRLLCGRQSRHRPGAAQGRARPPTGCIRACWIISARGRRSTRAASSCMARASAPIGPPSSRTPRRTAGRRRGAVAADPRDVPGGFLSAAGCTRANICSTSLPASLYVYGMKSADELMALPAEDVAADAGFARQAGGAAARGRRHQGHAGADRRSRTADQQRQRAARSLDQSGRRTHGPQRRRPGPIRSSSARSSCPGKCGI